MLDIQTGINGTQTVGQGVGWESVGEVYIQRELLPQVATAAVWSLLYGTDLITDSLCSGLSSGHLCVIFLKS